MIISYYIDTAVFLVAGCLFTQLQSCRTVESFWLGKKCRVFDDIQLRMAQNHPPLGDWVCVLRSCESPAF